MRNLKIIASILLGLSISLLDAHAADKKPIETFDRMQKVFTEFGEPGWVMDKKMEGTDVLYSVQWTDGTIKGTTTWEKPSNIASDRGKAYFPATRFEFFWRDRVIRKGGFDTIGIVTGYKRLPAQYQVTWGSYEDYQRGMSQWTEWLTAKDIELAKEP